MLNLSSDHQSSVDEVEDVTCLQSLRAMPGAEPWASQLFLQSGRPVVVRVRGFSAEEVQSDRCHDFGRSSKDMVLTFPMPAHQFTNTHAGNSVLEIELQSFVGDSSPHFRDQRAIQELDRLILAHDIVFTLSGHEAR
jgi:hypothetical protein